MQRRLRDRLACCRVELGQLVASEFAGIKQAEAFKLTIHDLRKIECKVGESKTVYQCEVEIDATWPIFGRKKQTLPVMLVKGPRGWQMPGGLSSVRHARPAASGQRAG